MSTVTAAASPSAASSTGSSNALSSLSSNFGNFLQMLMTQLQNQDPTSPMDTNQFTSELVQFTSVEQQINTNTSLTQLIQLTQAGEVMQSSAMIGKHVAVQANQIPLQNGTGSLQFNTASSQPVVIGVYNASGVKIQEADLMSKAGSNSWTWNGRDSQGNTMPDGAYKVTVTSNGTNGTSTAIPFTVLGTATGVASGTNAVQLQLGAVTVGFDAVKSVSN